MTDRPILSNKNLTPEAQGFIANFHRDVVNQIEEKIEKSDIVVVGMSQNPFVKKARKNLEAAGLSFQYLEYGGYFSQWRPRLAIKLWSGWPTFPQVFVKGKLVGGNAELEKAIQDGSVKTMLTSTTEPLAAARR